MWHVWHEAFTESSLIDRGYANFNEDSLIEFRFCPGTLRNDTGPDLVVFDARLTTNSYAVSTDHDGFAAELLLEADVELQPIGETRTFFFQTPPTQLFCILRPCSGKANLGARRGWEGKKMGILNILVRKSLSQGELRKGSQ